MPTLRFPLVGSVTSRENPLTNDQQFINCYPEVTINPVTSKQSVNLFKRPGYTKGSALAGVTAAGAAGAIVAWTGSASGTPPIAAAFLNTGGTSTSVWDLVSQAKQGGDIPTTNACTALTETIINTTPYLVGNFTNSGTNAVERWVYDEGGAWAHVTDADFPASTLVGFPAHLDGYVFDMTKSGRIYNSDLNTLTSYSATSYITADHSPDRGVTVASLGNLIVGFGEKSIEFFANAGNAIGSPLTRVGTALPMGATRRPVASFQTVLPANGTIYWIGTNSEGTATGIYRFKGTDPEKISSPAIDRIVSAGLMLGFLGTMAMHGMLHVVLFDSNSRTWCYCIDTKFWWRLTLASGNIQAVAPSAAITNEPTYFTTSANARANLTGGTQDDGSNYTLTVITENIDAETARRKFWKQLRVEADTQTSTSNLAVSWSDDDYTTFSTPVNIDMSSADMRIVRLGSSRRRAFKFTNAANTPCRIQWVNIDYDEANS